jgi:hypothetical protein
MPPYKFWVRCHSDLEPTKTKLVEFGRFAQKHAGKRGRNRPETIYFLGLTLYWRLIPLSQVVPHLAFEERRTRSGAGAGILREA